MPAAAILPAVISGAAGLGSAAIQSHGASKAAQLQEQNAREGLGTMRERTLNANDVLAQYLNNSIGTLEPYNTSGVSALDSLINGIKGGNSELNRPFTMADFQADPGYAFRQQQGEQAINRNAAAKGSVLGGGTLKSLQRFNSGLASQEYQNAYNRFTDQQNRRYQQLFGVAGLGQNSASQMADLYGSTGNQIAGNIYGEGEQELNALTGIGNARGAAAAARGSAYGGAVQNIGNQIGQALTMKQILAGLNPKTQTFSY